MVHGEGDPVAGKEKAAFCITCHGEGGNSVDPNIPKLAGQLDNYIVTVLVEFQKGVRRNPMMSNISTMVKKPEDMLDIAAYFSSQPAMQGQAVNSELAKQGEELFTTERCNYCHGDEGKRYSLFLDRTAPVIGGQHKKYLIKAIHDIKTGRRPGDSFDMMKKLLNELSEKEIEAIAEYLSGL